MSDQPATNIRTIEGLEGLSFKSLKSIAKTIGADVFTGDRAGSIQALAGVIGSPRHRAIVEKNLTATERFALTLLPVRSGPFRLRGLVVALIANGYAPAEGLAAIVGLLSHGCLLPHPRSWVPGYHLSISVDELRNLGLRLQFQVTPPVLPWLEAWLPASIATEASPPATSADAAFPELQRAAFVVLAEAREKPIRLTSQGAPYKADQNRLAAAFVQGASATGRSTKRKRASHDLPLIAAFALAILIGSRLLRDDDATIRPTDAATKLFAASTAEQARAFFMGWRFAPLDESGVLREAWSDDPDAEEDWLDATTNRSPVTVGQLADARATLIEAIKTLTAGAPDRWYDVDGLSRFISEQHPEFLFEKIDDYILRRALTPRRGVAPSPEERDARATLGENVWADDEIAFVLASVATSLRWLGIIDVSADAVQPLRYRLSPLGQHLLFDTPMPVAEAPPTGHAVVQPSFEIVVLDATANLPLLAQLDEFAERRSFDRAATYHLTQAALVQGMDRGWTSERIFATLESAHGGPLPQNVAVTLRDWIARYEHLSIREAATLLEADTPAQLDSWLADPRLTPLLGRRLGPTSVLVPTSNAERVAAQIQADGSPLAIANYAQPKPAVIRIVEPNRLDVDLARADAYVHYRLRGFAEPDDPRGSSYRLTPESVSRATTFGWTGHDIVRFLRQSSDEKLPADVLASVLGWSGVVPAITAETLVAVRVPAKPLGWDTLREIPAIGRLIRARIAPEVAIVSTTEIDALRAELTRRGIVLREQAIDDAVLGAHRLADDIFGALDGARSPQQLLARFQGMLRNLGTK